MEKYISKSALVSEIERFIERAKAERVLHPKTILAAKNYLLIEDYNKLLSFINTLEVKEVDLEKEINEHWNDWAKKDGFYSTEFAKYFFELGLKAQKEE